MVEEWPFFQTQINMLEMVLCKADAEISERYDETLVSPKLKLMGDSFRSRLAKLIDSINRIKNQEILLEGNPEIRLDT